MSKTFHWGKKSMELLAYVEPIVVKLCNEALKESKIDFKITSGLRTSEQQKALFLNKKSELDGINRLSDHQVGMAVDVYPISKLNCFDYDDDEVKLVWQEIHRAFLRAAFHLGLNIELGFAYIIGGYPDYPHIAVKD